MSKELEELKIIRQSINDMLDKGMSMDGDIAISLEKRLDNIATTLKAFEILKPYIELRQYAHMNSYYLMLNDEEIIELNKNQYKIFEEWLNAE